jgi:hypothetical protein
LTNPADALEVGIPVQKMSSSEEVAFKTCRLAHLFQYELGYGPRLTNRKLSLGINVHGGLEVLYLGGSREDIFDKMEQHSEERWAEIQAVGADKDANVRVEFIKDRDLAVAMVNGYMDWVTIERIDEGYETVSVEEKLYMQVPGAVAVMPLKLDLLQRKLATGRLRTVDFKTAASFTTDLTKYQLSEQNGNYALGVTAVYGERPTEMAYRELRKMAPSTNPKSKPPYFREILVRLTAEEMLHRAEEYAKVTVERFDPDRAIYANPSACCGSWKNDWQAPCLMVSQGRPPLEALDASQTDAPQDSYKRYVDETEELPV